MTVSPHVTIQTDHSKSNRFPDIQQVNRSVATRHNSTKSGANSTPTIALHRNSVTSTKSISLQQNQRNHEVEIVPKEGLFRDVNIGDVYAINFTVKNVSKHIMCVRVSPPSTKEFNLISDLKTKKEIAPGLDFPVQITFSCDKEMNYHDRFIVMADSINIEVPLHAYHPAPDFVIPPVFDLGTVVPNMIATKYFEILNKGSRDGRYVMHIPDDVTNTTVTPMQGIIPPHATQKLKIQLSGIENVGVAKSQIIIELSDGQKRNIEIIAKIVESRLELVYPDGKGLVSSTHFGSIYFGQKKNVKTFLVNNSPFRSNFSIGKANEDSPSDDISQVDEEEAPPPAITVSPHEGQLGPFEQVPIIFSFHPILQKTTKGFKSKLKDPTTDFLDFKEEFLVEIAETDQRIEVSCTGTALKPYVQLSDKKFLFGECPVNEHLDILLSLKNCNKLALDYSISKVAHFHSRPSSGLLQPLETKNIMITFSPSQLGKFQNKLLLTMGGGLVKIPIYVSGCSESIEKKKKIIGGIDKTVEDFEEKPNYVQSQSAQETERNLMKTPFSYKQHKEKVPSQFDFPSEASMLVYLEYKKKKENQQIYNSFIKSLREQKENKIKLKELDQLKAYLNEVDLGMEPASGLESPKPSMKYREEKLFIADQFSGGGAVTSLMRKPRKFDESKLIKKKFKPYPTTPVETRECKIKLTSKQTQKIASGPKTLDFGKLSVFAKKTKNFSIRNELKQYVLVQIGSQTTDIKVSPKSQVIPPLCTTGFDVEFCANTAQLVQQTLFFLVNEHSKVKFFVLAEVIPIDIALSTSEIRYRFNEFSLEPSITETVSLTNKGNAMAHFNWIKTQVKSIRDDSPNTENSGAPTGRAASQNSNTQSHSSRAASIAPPNNFGDQHLTSFRDGSRSNYQTPSIENSEERGGLSSSRQSAQLVEEEIEKLFILSPMEGDIEPGKSQIIEVKFTPGSMHRVEQTFILQVQGSDGPKTLTCIGDISESKLTYIEKKLEYGIIPVGLKKQKTITLKNTGENAGVFHVKNLPPEFKVTPMKGRITKGSSEKLLVELKPVSAKVFDEQLTIGVRGGRTLRIGIKGEAKIPLVEIDAPEILDFGSLFVGFSARLKIGIKNVGGNIPAILSLDLTNYPDFFVINEKGERIIEGMGGDSIAVFPDLSDDESDGDEKIDKEMTMDDEEEELDDKYLENEPSHIQGGMKYRLTVEPNNILILYLAFKPSFVGDYDFPLPLSLAGIAPSISGFSRQINAKALKPRLIFSHQVVDFMNRVLVKDGISVMPHRQLITISNEDSKELLWELNLKDVPSRIFRIEPCKGALSPGQTTQLQIFFTPREPIEYHICCPIYLDGQREKSYFDLIVKGIGSKPTLTFDRKEIVLSVVPLGIKSTDRFTVINEGYENIELKYKLPVDNNKMPLSLNFPEGTILSREKLSVPVEVSFVSKKPVSFTAKIDFYDADGNKFVVSVTGTSDNSLLTCYPYLVSNRDKYTIDSDDKKPYTLTETNSNSLSPDTDDEFTSPRSHSVASGATATSSLVSGKERVRRHIYSKTAISRLLNWLNVNVLSNPVDDLIKSLLFSNGGIIYEVIQYLSGKTPEGKAMKIPENRSEACHVLVEQYKKLINFLKSHGGMLNNIKPQYLLRYDDYQKYTSEKNRKTSISTSTSDPEVPSSGKKVMTERVFRYRMYEAWLVLIFQVIKIFAIQRINTKSFRKTPGIPNDTISTIPDSSLIGSNIYSVGESILLRWMSYHYNKVYPSKNGQYKFVKDFGTDLSDCIVFAAMVQSHIPTSIPKFETLNQNAKDSIDYEHNASLLVGVLKEYRLDYVLSIKDFVKANPRDLLLFTYYLYQNLPNFVPRATIMFEGNLQETIIKYIELTNPTKYAIEYYVTLDGSPAFKIQSEKVLLKPKSSSKFEVQVTPRFSKPVDARITFHGQRINSYQPSTMVFNLSTKIITESFVKVYEVSSTVFEVKFIEIEVTNPFDKNSQFTVSISQSCSEKRNKIEAFWCPMEFINLRKQETKKIGIQYIPFIAKAAYECRILFSDPKIGEFVYLINGKCLPSNPVEEFKVICEAKSSTTKEITFSSSNPAIEKASTFLKERLKKLRLGRNISPIPEGDEVTYKVTYSSPFFSGPDTFSFNRKTNREKPKILVTFSPNRSGVYPCTITIESDFDYRVFNVEGKARSPGVKLELEFSTPVRNKVVQEIPIANRSSKPWKIQATVTGKYFTGPNELRVSPGKSIIFPLVFHPKQMGKFTGELVLSNPDTLERYTYSLIGDAEEPLYEERIEITCKAREKLEYSLPITNQLTTKEKSTKFKVDCDIPFVSGRSDYVADEEAQGSYKMMLNPSQGGNYTGAIVFTAQNGEYMWYVLDIKVSRSPAEGTLNIESTVRSTAEKRISIKNPSAEKVVTFGVTILGTGLSGDETFALEAGETRDFILKFTPLKIGNSSGSISFFNEEFGELWYEIELESRNSPPIKVPPMKCEIGKRADFKTFIENPGSSPVSLKYECSNVNNFSLSPNAIILEPYETKTIILHYFPSSIEKEEIGIIRLSNPNVGDWTFQCSGIGEKPTEMDEIKIYGQVNRSTSGLVTFKSPFPVQKKILIRLETVFLPKGVDDTEETFQLILKKSSSNESPLQSARSVQIDPTPSSTNYNVLGPFGTLQIPFSFSPMLIAEYKANIYVTVLEDNLVWTFPIRGIAEVNTNESFFFQCQARQSVEKILEITLLGFSSVIVNDKGELEEVQEEQFSHELVFIEKDQRFLKAMKRSFSLIPLDDSLALNLDGETFISERTRKSSLSKSEAAKKIIRFIAKFSPLRPFHGYAELYIRKQGGGVWRYDIQFEATIPEIDDKIEINAAIGKTEKVVKRLTNKFAHQAPFEAYFTHESPLDFQVSPSKGILASYGYEGTPFTISYTANNYGKTSAGTLVIDTEEMQWRFLVYGVLPKYNKPNLSQITSKVDNRLLQRSGKETQKQQSARNPIQTSIRNHSTNNTTSIFNFVKRQGQLAPLSKKK